MNLTSVSERYGRLFEKVQKDFLTVKRKGKKKSKVQIRQSIFGSFLNVWCMEL